MVKCCSDHADAPDFLKRFVQNLSNSQYWTQDRARVVSSGGLSPFKNTDLSLIKSL